MDVDLELGGAQAAAIALAIVSGACLLGLLFWWTRQTNRRAAESPAAGAVELHASMVRLQEELPQLLRTMSGRLDAKMRALSDLIHEAGGTIDELRRLRSAATANPEAPADPSHVSARATQKDSHQEPATHLLAADATDPTDPTDHRDRADIVASPARAADPTELRSERYAHVYSLADDGLDAAEIAAETGMHRGEVELVLSLRRKRVRVDRGGGRPEPNRIVRSPEEATV
jgi:cell pole-organizing protein PopZ